MDTEERHGECKLQLQEEGKGVEEVRQEVTKVKVRGDEMKSRLVHVGHIRVWAVAKMQRCKDARMPRG